MTGEHRRRYRLGYGVTVEFVFRPVECRKGEVSMTALVCEWHPAPPRFRHGNARNEFLRRYHAARGDFYQDVAQLLGGSLLNVDLDDTAGQPRSLRSRRRRRTDATVASSPVGPRRFASVAST